MIQVTTLTTGPAQGTLTLLTGVEGKAARMGHALTIEVAAWECRTDLDGPTPVSVVLTAQLPSIAVIKGEGGVKPVSDKDRRSIKDNALKTLGADKNPGVTFTSTAVQKAGAGWSLLGDLQLNGVTKPLAVDVTIAGEGIGQRITGTARVTQTEHKISPYSGMLGALQVSDEVQIVVDVLVVEG